MNSTFRAFKKAVEGHLLQVGAGYLTNPTFLDMYKRLGEDCLKCDAFWKMFKVSYAQAVYDRNYLYGILVTATMNLQHKTILKFEKSQDGILAWEEFKQDFEYDGSKELRLEQLESLASKPYSSSEAGGMSSYIDKFQSYMAELETINPTEYTDYRKKRTLLANIRQAEGVAHLIQKCRDDKFMSYDQCAAYLRENALYIDRVNQAKTPSRLLHVQEEPEPVIEEKSVEEVTRLFSTMAQASNMHQTYKMFNTKSFRESLSIPDAIWNELEPLVKDKIQEARIRIREKKKAKLDKQQNNSLPNQYPTMKNRETMLNMVTAMAEMSMDDEDSDTDDDMITSSAYMARSFRTLDPPGESCKGKDDVLEVRAHFEYTLIPELQSKVYAISDSGADACILGKSAKVISYTGRYASLVGYDPYTTRTEKVPIVSAYIKARSSSIGNHPVLLKVHEAPYNPQSPITLLSEYQIRENGLVIDSVAKKHKSSYGKQGTQSFQLNQWVYIDFEDRGEGFLWVLSCFPLKMEMRTSMISSPLPAQADGTLKSLQVKFPKTPTTMIQQMKIQ